MPLEWVYATVCMVAGMDVVCYILYRWLHVRLRGVVSAVIVIMSPPFVAPYGRVGVVGGAAVV